MHELIVKQVHGNIKDTEPKSNGGACIPSRWRDKQKEWMCPSLKPSVMW